jgi:hypothetical protein
MSHPVASWSAIPDPDALPSDAVRSSATFTPGVDLQLDDDGDLLIGRDATFTTGLDAVKQGARIRCQTFRGEVFCDLDFGIPYYQEILGQKYSDLKVRTPFREMLENTPGVVEVSSLSTSFDRSTRRTTVTWKVRGDEGTIQDSLEV